MTTLQSALHAATAALLLAVLPALAQTPQQQLDAFRREAQDNVPGFKEFSAVRGEQFFKATHGSDWSCATCHTGNPTGQGKHARTSKPIKPLAPVANAERFSDPAKVEKWFKRNCNDVLSRPCTAQEKGDVLTFLTTLK